MRFNVLPSFPRRGWGWLPAVFALLLVASAHAAVTVTMPKAGHYTLSVTEGKNGPVIAGPMTVTEAKADIDVKGTGKDRLLTVDDTDSGNAAVLPVPASGTGDVAVKPDAFRYIARTIVTVTDKKGQVPTVAAVTLTDGKDQAQTVTLRPEDAGKATFSMVASGDGKIRVQQGKPDNQQTITVRIPTDHPKPTLELTADVALPDGMQTAAAAAPNAPATPAAPAPAPAPKEVPHMGGFLSGVIGFLIALVILGIILVLALRVLRARGITAASALAAAGVQLPDTPEEIPAVAAPPPTPVDPTVCPFCGAKKEPNAPCPNCAVSPSPGGSFATFSPVASGGGKRLVAVAGPRAGTIFPLTGPLTIGRDPGRDIAITEDASLSRSHALVQPENGGAVVVDQGSSNGTWVNGQRVSRQALRPGDEITAGSTRFRYEE